jgi:superfamily II DNA helicase RecQ
MFTTVGGKASPKTISVDCLQKVRNSKKLLYRLNTKCSIIRLMLIRSNSSCCFTSLNDTSKLSVYGIEGDRCPGWLESHYLLHKNNVDLNC